MVTGIALVLSGWIVGIGKYGGLYPLMAKLRLIGSFRASSRYRLISQIGLAMLTAIGLTDLITYRKRGETLERPLIEYRDFTGAVIPAGRHHVIFEFEPASFQ